MQENETEDSVLAMSTESLRSSSEDRSDVSTQIDDNEIGMLKSRIEQLKKDSEKLKQQIDEAKFSVELIKTSDKLTRFYTGLPTWAAFVHILNFISPHVIQGRTLSKEDELFLVLVKLQFNLLDEDLAGRFHISASSVSRIFQKWIDVMYFRLQFLIIWPTREVLHHNMPQVFKELYPRCRCIIDCSEIFIERPTSFKARA